MLVQRHLLGKFLTFCFLFRLTPSPIGRPTTTTATTDSSRSESRTRRVMKRVARVARRYLIIDKISRRRSRHTSTTTTTTTSSQRLRQQQQQQGQQHLSDLEHGGEDDLDLIERADRPNNLARSLEQQVRLEKWLTYPPLPHSHLSVIKGRGSIWGKCAWRHSWMPPYYKWSINLTGHKRVISPLLQYSWPWFD